MRGVGRGPSQPHGGGGPFPVAEVPGLGSVVFGVLSRQVKEPWPVPAVGVPNECPDSEVRVEGRNGWQLGRSVSNGRCLLWLGRPGYRHDHHAGSVGCHKRRNGQGIPCRGFPQGHWISARLSRACDHDLDHIAGVWRVEPPVTFLLIVGHLTQVVGRKDYRARGVPASVGVWPPPSSDRSVGELIRSGATAFDGRSLRKGESPGSRLMQAQLPDSGSLSAGDIYISFLFVQMRQMVPRKPGRPTATLVTLRRSEVWLPEAP